MSSKTPLKKFDLVEAQIENLSKKGAGLCSVEVRGAKRLVEIRNTIPGDLVSFHVPARRMRQNLCIDPLAILSPSIHRTEPRCAHSNQCGGCGWQAMSYSFQLAEKQALVERLFTPFIPSSKIHPIIEALQPFHYRNKMEFTFSQDLKGTQYLGLNQPGKREKVINVNYCHLVEGWMSEVLTQARLWWSKHTDILAYHFASGRGCLRTLTLRDGKSTGSKMIILTIAQSVEYMLTGPVINSFKKYVLELFKDEPIQPSIFLRIHSVKKTIGDEFYEMHLHGKPTLKEELTVKGNTFSFEVSPSAFFQPNSKMAEVIYERAITMASVTSKDYVLDLYAGAATFGIMFSPFVNRVLSIEINPYAVCDAEMNIYNNDIDNLSIMKGDVANLLEHCHSIPDVVVVDPPRAGLSPVAINHILRLKPKKIVYVACNPYTQADNMKDFLAAGYEIVEVQPIDQFPQTVHLENIVLLQQTL